MTIYSCPKPTRRLPAEKRRVAKVSRRPSAKDRATADWLCAALVKERAGYKCEARAFLVHFCSPELDWAHGIPRRVLALRWAHANTAAICRAAHRIFTDSPALFERWRIFYFGGLVCDQLAEKALELKPVDVSQVISDLRQGRTQLERS